MKKFNPLSWLLPSKSEASVDALAHSVSLLQSWLDAGIQVVRSGGDALLIHPDGRVERVDDFFVSANELLNSELAHDLTLAWSQLLGQVDTQPVQLAQLATPGASALDSVTPPPSATPPATPVANVLASTPIAQVTEVFGIVQVVRSGEVVVLTAGAPIYLGDVVNTQANSTVKLEFNATKDAGTLAMAHPLAIRPK